MAEKTYGEYVDEAYELFIKNAGDCEPTSGEEAIAKYFAKSASEELKAKVEAAGKTAKDAWEFVTEIARRHRLEHIDPVNVYAIAMHYFEDVPKDARVAAPTKAASASKAKQPAVNHPAKRPAKQRKRPKKQQGFFFDVLGQEEAGNADA
ncbi:MAG: hypothetical protein IKO64_05555 [Kiritimatiellae bacterium]|nr:hypothetical protein [Kiritimatiellia bacterium]